MPRTVFSLLFLTTCASVAVACSSVVNPPTAGSGSGSGSSSGMASGGSTGASTGTASGSSGSGAIVCPSTMSFKNDIIPFFQVNCAKPSACHNDPSTYVKTASGGGRPYLGTAIDGGAETMADIATVYGNLMKPALEYVTPKINYVAPGDPTMSFLMFKMDPDLNAKYDSPHCTNGDYVGTCGLEMPTDLMPVGSLLPQATRDKVRCWIKQGAMNN